MEVKVNIEGTVKATCDRCLGVFDLMVRGRMNLYVKQAERDSGTSLVSSLFGDFSFRMCHFSLLLFSY